MASTNKLAVLVLVKNIREKYLLAKNLYVGEKLFLSSQTYSCTNIQKILQQHTLFANIFHQDHYSLPIE